MPRGPRLDAEGALHHVMVRGLEKRKIFLSRMDREDLLRESRAELMGVSRRRQLVEERNLVSYVPVHGYGMTLTHVARGLKVSIQSGIRGVDNGADGFRKRGWRL